MAYLVCNCIDHDLVKSKDLKCKKLSFKCQFLLLIIIRKLHSKKIVAKKLCYLLEFTLTRSTR